MGQMMRRQSARNTGCRSPQSAHRDTDDKDIRVGRVAGQYRGYPATVAVLGGGHGSLHTNLVRLFQVSVNADLVGEGEWVGHTRMSRETA